MNWQLDFVVRKEATSSSERGGWIVGHTPGTSLPTIKENNTRSLAAENMN